MIFDLSALRRPAVSEESKWRRSGPAAKLPFRAGSVQLSRERLRVPPSLSASAIMTVVSRSVPHPKPNHPTLEALLAAVRNCRACEAHLPLGPRPVLRAAATSRILVVGQAPGLRVHTTGTPWDDASGERLRGWMGVDDDTFYDESRIAIIPMGYCYPGRGNGGDRPPRRECAELWLAQLLAKLPQIELTLLVGQHAQRHFLGGRRESSLAETVKAWRTFAPQYIPLPHPSPRNTPWLQRNAWFEREVLPELRTRIAALLAR